MKARLGPSEVSEVFIDDVKEEGVDIIYSRITHYVGDDCQPNGHRDEAAGQ